MIGAILLIKLAFILGAAWLLAGRLNLQALRYTAMRGAYERAAQYLRRVGDQGRLGRAITVIAIGYTHGPTPVPEAVEGCERLTRQAGENRGLAATIRGCIAWLEAMRGDFTRAWMLLDDTAAVLKDIGHTVGWIPRSMYRGWPLAATTVPRAKSTAPPRSRSRYSMTSRPSASCRLNQSQPTCSGASSFEPNS